MNCYCIIEMLKIYFIQSKKKFQLWFFRDGLNQHMSPSGNDPLWKLITLKKWAHGARVGQAALGARLPEQNKKNNPKVVSLE